MAWSNFSVLSPYVSHARHCTHTHPVGWLGSLVGVDAHTRPVGWLGGLVGLVINRF